MLFRNREIMPPPSVNGLTTIVIDSKRSWTKGIRIVKSGVSLVEQRAPYRSNGESRSPQGLAAHNTGMNQVRHGPCITQDMCADCQVTQVPRLFPGGAMLAAAGWRRD